MREDMEVLNKWASTMEVETSAAKALSDWQAFFAGQAMQRAKEIAEQSGTNRISISQLSQAALDTVAGLESEIKRKSARDDDRRAA